MKRYAIFDDDLLESEKGSLVKYIDVEKLIEQNEYFRDYISYLLGTYSMEEFDKLVEKKYINIEKEFIKEF